jgi:hypothetical protein
MFSTLHCDPPYNLFLSQRTYFRARPGSACLQSQLWRQRQKEPEVRLHRMALSQKAEQNKTDTFKNFLNLWITFNSTLTYCLFV